VLGAVESTYSRWLAASPLEKLSIEPQGCIRIFNQGALQNDKKYSSTSSMASLDGALQNHADDSNGLSEALAGGDRGNAYGQDWDRDVCSQATGSGDKCTYSHSMAGMDKDVRAKKCLRCGSEAHRQKDCQVGRPQPKGARDGLHKPPAAATGQSAQSTMATAGASSTSPSSAGETIPGTAWTLETLIQAAQQIVHPAATDGQASDTSPEKTRPQLKVLKLRDIRICSADSSATALVDSGATHSLRSAASQEEWDKSSEVMVQLAGNYKLVMRISDVGTLLMPYRDVQVNQQHLPGPQAQTIVPMGQLIETLGYTMMWSPKECYLQSPEGVRIPLQVDGGCPQLAEMEALALIARLEDRKVEELNNSVLTTQDKLKVSAVAMEHTWEYYLFDYVAKGAFESGLRAVRERTVFRRPTRRVLVWYDTNCRTLVWLGHHEEPGLLEQSAEKETADLQKVDRIVHLFAGKEGHYEMFKLDQGDTAVVELDIERCQGHDLFRAETWRMLLWGAKEGKSEAVFGGPPGRALQKGKGGRRDNKSTALVARMMWLYSMAQAGREVNGTPSAKSREVGFMIEYPEGISPEIRGAEDARINEYEDATRVAEGRGGVAGWYETIHYWEAVQRPRLDRELGLPTMDGRVFFWDTRMWKSFQRENGLQTVSFDQGAMGGRSRNPTTLGTNVNNLMALADVRVGEGEAVPEAPDNEAVWAPGLVHAVVVAFSFWYYDTRCVPRVCAMTPEQWKEHVRTNHAIYRKDCVTCVMSKGVGRQHRRIRHPDAYVLTADVAGPLSPGLDATSKGTLGKNLKYLLVGKYLVPKQYIEDYTGQPTPSVAEVREHDLLPPLTDEQKKDMEELFGESGSGTELPLECPQVEVVGDEATHLQYGPEDEEMRSYEPSEAADEEVGSEEELEASRDAVMKDGDCEAPEMTHLVFATALPNNQAATVKRGIQDMVLYLQNHGFPVYRFHADKGEFYNHGFRNWLRDQGVYGTWSEPSVPQGNGRLDFPCDYGLQRRLRQQRNNERECWDGKLTWRHHLELKYIFGKRHSTRLDRYEESMDLKAGGWKEDTWDLARSFIMDIWCTYPQMVMTRRSFYIQCMFVRTL
ncbi:ycf43, partial [Symbiodinium sp. CCMP2456]